MHHKMFVNHCNYIRSLVGLVVLLSLCHWSTAKLHQELQTTRSVGGGSGDTEDVTFLGQASSITPCARDDPQLERCIINAVYQLRPLLTHGNLGEGYRTPPLEPLELDNIDLGRNSQFQASFTQLEARGGSNFIIDRLIAKPEDISYDLWLTLPRIDFKGKYFMRLNLLLLDIKGNGNMRGSCDNAKAAVKMRGTRYLRHGQEYVKFTKMSMRIQFKDFKLDLENLFNGDALLGEVGNTLINNNQDLYLNEIIPGLERGLSKKFLDVANEILATATFDEMFPPGRTVINPIAFPKPNPNPGPSIFEPSFSSRNPLGGILDQLPPRTPKRPVSNSQPTGGIFEDLPGGGIIDPRLNLGN